MQQSITLADVIRRLLRRGHSMKSLGERVGLTQPSISRLAAGKTKDASFSVGLRLVSLAGGRVELPADESSVAATEAESSHAG